MGDECESKLSWFLYFKLLFAIIRRLLKSHLETGVKRKSLLLAALILTASPSLVNEKSGRTLAFTRTN